MFNFHGVLIRYRGYNWISNGVGLTIDIVLEYQLVTPKGDIESVTAESNPDLFFALSVCSTPNIFVF